MLCLLLASTSAQAANPVIPTGGSAALAAVGMDYPATSLTWDIIRPGNPPIPIATSAAPNGWAVTQDWGSGILAVSVPTNATPATGLEVRFRAGGAFGSPPPIHRSAFFDVTAATGLPRVSSLSITPSSIQAWRSATGTVTLNAAAPTGGTTVLLSNTVGENVATPASSYVVVPQGATSTTFVAQSNNNVASNTALTFRADVGGSSATSVLTVTPIVVVSLTFDVLSIKANGTATGTVTLNGAVGHNPAILDVPSAQLSSDSTGVSVPSLATIPVGSSTGTFTVTGNNPLSATTANITATYNGASATEAIDVFAPIHLDAITTGSGRNTLYWGGVSGAIGYNIYRGTVSGGPYVKINTTPVTTLDPGPGLTNTYQFANTGLTNGTEYFYYVASVLSGGTEGVRSDEASAIPDATDFLPWDTGTPAQIIAKVSLAEQACHQDWQNPPDIIGVTGPDGVAYMQSVGGSATAYAPNMKYDDTLSLLYWPGGQVVPTPHHNGTDPHCPHNDQHGPPWIPFNHASGGIFRKFVSRIGQYGFVATVGLPKADQTNEYYAKHWTMAESGLPNDTDDAAWIYVGSCQSGNMSTQDIGFQCSPLPNGVGGWKLSLGSAEGTHTPVMSFDPGLYVSFDTGYVTGSSVVLGYYTPGAPGAYRQWCALSIDGNIHNYSQGVFHHVFWYVAEPAMMATTQSRNGRAIKWLNVIAQPGTLIATRDAARRRQGLPALNYLPDGSHIGYAPNDGQNYTGAFWGWQANPLDNSVDGYVTLIPGGQPTESLIYNQGSLPNGNPPGSIVPGVVTWIDDNPFFWERQIILNAIVR